MSSIPGLIILPGALGAAKQFSELKQLLDNDFNVHLFEYPGHGSDEILSPGVSAPGLVSNLEAYIETRQLTGCLLFGYSLGGYIGLLLAGKNNGSISGVVTFATKTDWTPEVAQNETKEMNPSSIINNAPAFADRLEQLHGSRWKSLVESTAQLILSIGNDFPNDDFFKSIQCPVKIMSGDNDKMVPVETSAKMFRLIPRSALSILPRTSHPIEKADVSRLALEILSFKKEIFSKK